MPNELVPTAETSVLVPVEPGAFEIFERSQIDMQISTAKAHPRPPLAALIREMEEHATYSVEIAERCFYTLKRYSKAQDKEVLITGPSIKLAQIATSCWENICCGSWVHQNDGRVVTARGLCWDLQKNNRQFADEVRRITTKEGRPYSEDMAIQTAKAACAIARRNAIFQVIDESITWTIFQACMKRAAGTKDELAGRLEKALKWFALKSVTHDMVLSLLDKPSIDKLDQDDLVLLQGLATAIKDRETTVSELFGTGAEIPQTRDQLDEMVEKWRAEKAAKKDAK